MPRQRVARKNELLVDFRKGPRKRLVEALRELGLSKAKAEKLVDVYPDGRGLDEAGIRALEELGLTETEAKRVKAAFSVVRVCDEACEQRATGSTVRMPSDVVGLLRTAIGRKPQEYFAVILMDARQRAIDIMGVSVGSLAQVDVHPRELMREAVRRGAHAIILAHNHPSGSADPSRADLELTERMKEVGQLLGIPVLDHIIIAGPNFQSLASLGYI